MTCTLFGNAIVCTSPHGRLKLDKYDAAKIKKKGPTP